MRETSPRKEAEQGPRPRVILPRGWGNGELSMDVQFSVVYGGATEEEAMQRARVDKEIREMMDTLGISVVERNVKGGEFVPVESLNEFTVVNSERTSKNELAQVREAVPDVKIPKTYSAEDFENGMLLPVVAAFGVFSGGADKYLIETEEQRRSLIGFWSGKEGEQIDKDSFTFKEFIDTPGDHFTSYRVIVSARGKIMASAILYSGHSKDNPEYKTSGRDPETLGMAGTRLLSYLDTEESPYYLHSRRFTSNIAGGGGCIPLNPTERSRNISDAERSILMSHGISEAAELPELIADQASRIGASLGRKMGLVVGIDFIQDKEGNVYYLETNAGPGVDTYLAVHNNGEGDIQDGYRMLMRDALTDIAA